VSSEDLELDGPAAGPDADPGEPADDPEGLADLEELDGPSGAAADDEPARSKLGAPDFLVPERKARIDEVVANRTRTLTVVIEAFCDPQNANAVLRTCEAFGVQDVHVVEGLMKPYDRNKKVSQNADKWLDVHRWKTTRACLEHLAAEGYAIYATHLGPGSRALEELSFAGKVALVFGNEHRGVSADALALADAQYVIPMRGFVQSLNVSVAAAISIARAVERRVAERGRHGDLPEPEAAALRERFYVLAVKQRARIGKAEVAAARRARMGGRPRSP
jgi:tRNA (guanosine-2'-O-)-methyltransferase